MTINSSSIVFGCMNATMIKNEVILPIDLNGWQVNKKKTTTNQNQNKTTDVQWTTFLLYFFRIYLKSLNLTKCFAAQNVIARIHLCEQRVCSYAMGSTHKVIISLCMFLKLKVLPSFHLKQGRTIEKASLYLKHNLNENQVILYIEL